MRSMYRLQLLALASAVALAIPAAAQDKKGSATPAAAPKAADSKAAPAKGQEERKVLVDNDKVLVTEKTYKPGASSAMRERGARVARSLTDATMEKTMADGKKQVIQWKKGEVKYFPKETFVQKNVGKIMGREIVYERSRAQVQADIDRLDPRLKKSR